jgi:hypothetical protein
MEDRPEEASVPPPSSFPWDTGLPPGGSGYEEPPPPSEPPAPPPPLPWEDPGRPWLGALVATVALIYQQPRQAFERMALTGDPLRPLMFSVLVQWPVFIVGGLFAMATRGSLGSSIPAGNPILHYEEMYFRLLPVFVLLAPLWILVGILVSAAIRHLFLMLVGGAKWGFQATLRTLCYSTAGALLAAVPCLGGLLAAVAVIAFEIIGLSAAHRITKVRAAMAFVLPALLCCVCFSFLFALIQLAALHHGGPR